MAGGNINVFFKFKKYLVASAYVVRAAQAYFALVFKATANAGIFGLYGEGGFLTGARLGEVALGFAGAAVETAIKGAVELKIKGVTGGWEQERDE